MYRLQQSRGKSQHSSDLPAVNTSALMGFNRQLGKETKVKSVFPKDNIFCRYNYSKGAAPEKGAAPLL